MTNTMNNLYASLVATGFAELTTIPVCTVKTNYQNTNSTSVLSTAKHIYTTRGLKAFYMASPPAIFGQMLSTSSKYTLYRWFGTSETYPIKNKFANGITAGFISSLATHPLDVAKVHLQMKQSVFKEIQQSGLSILYRGYSKTFSKVILASSMFFPIYETIKEKVNSPVLASATSGLVATTMMQPVDYLKTRHMMGLSLYNGLNLKHYYKGYFINLLRIVPHFVITMCVIEYIIS